MDIEPRGPLDLAASPTDGGGKGDGIEEFGYRQELKRTLKFSDLLVYGLIFMVPIAPFAIFGSV
ncbi:MAG: putative amino acid transporter, partial [Massilia sp.]|nr:putative amino acid transporter [Massilia sp.]